MVEVMGLRFNLEPDTVAKETVAQVYDKIMIFYLTLSSPRSFVWIPHHKMAVSAEMETLPVVFKKCE